MTDGKGYTFPDPPDPGSMLCIKCYVPADTVYIGAFWNAYRYFGSPQAWANDEAHTALEVAALWRTAYEMAREAFEEGDCDMKFDIRQNPLNKCQMQASTDGGLTWHLALDLGCAGGSVSTAPPTEDGQAGEIAAIYIRQFIMVIIQFIVDAAGDYPTFLTNVTNFLTPYGVPAKGVEGYLTKVWVDRGDPGSYPAIDDDCEYECLYTDLRDYVAHNPIDWLDNLSTWLGAWLNCTNWTMMDALNKTAAYIGNEVLGQIIRPHVYWGGGAGFGGLCEMTPRCDTFEDSDEGWTLGEFGEYLGDPGGFRGTLNPATGRYEVEISSTNIPFGYIHQIRLDWGNLASGPTYQMWVDGTLLLDDSGGAAGARTNFVVVDGAVNHVRVKITQSTLNLGPNIYRVCYEDV